jgi:nitroreductase
MGGGSKTGPDFPEFGAAVPIVADAGALQLLAHRRSSSAQGLGAPGPDKVQLDTLLRLAVRVPDHGKLAPWRFIVLEKAAKPRLLATLEALADGQAEPDTARAKLAKLAAAPISITVVSRIDPAVKIPVWEQELSAGAVCMNLLVAAQAMGFGANWITDWYAYDPEAKKLLGLEHGERIAGFVHIGTPAETPLERPRPDPEALTTYWAG